MSEPEEVEFCGCTNEELEAGRTCGQPQCPNLPAELESRRAGEHTPPVEDAARGQCAGLSGECPNPPDATGYCWVHVLHESSPRHPDPRCHECGERLADADRAEVYLDSRRLRQRDEAPPRDDAGPTLGPFLVHADPCYVGNKEKYELA